MIKEGTRKAKTGDDLEILSEIIKNDPWLLEKVLNKIKFIRGGGTGVLDSMAGKTETPLKKRAK
ncbi:MAG: hypothetical protein H7249_11625 [Chitinophagaceae bacterium]|nr:hypothetical protein [Oligoflexus sp.]